MLVHQRVPRDTQSVVDDMLIVTTPSRPAVMSLLSAAETWEKSELVLAHCHLDIARVGDGCPKNVGNWM